MTGPQAFPTPPAPPSGQPGERRERGSAFTVALLVLLVLTISGLALTLMTQTEVRIGGNERTTNRTFYAADSGIEVATARQNSIGADTQLHVFKLNTTQQDTGSGAPTTFSDQVTITPLIPVSVQLCNYTAVNNSSQQYSCITYAANSTAARTGVNGATTEGFSSKLVAAMLTMMPQASSNSSNPIQAQIPVQF